MKSFFIAFFILASSALAAEPENIRFYDDQMPIADHLRDVGPNCQVCVDFYRVTERLHHFAGAQIKFKCPNEPEHVRYAAFGVPEPDDWFQFQQMMKGQKVTSDNKFGRTQLNKNKAWMEIEENQETLLAQGAFKTGRMVESSKELVGSACGKEAREAIDLARKVTEIESTNIATNGFVTTLYFLSTPVFGRACKNASLSVLYQVRKLGIGDQGTLKNNLNDLLHEVPGF